MKLELLPGKGLGDFLLGMSVSEAVNVVKQNLDSISSVELKFNESAPLTMDIIMDLVEDGLLLRFDPATQRLKTIEIYDVPKVVLSYSGSIFSGSDVAPTFVLIYSRFGPSYPGDYNVAKNIYSLYYPNLAFTFPIPAKYQSLYADSSELPVEFPDGSTPITTKITLFIGSSIESMVLPPLPPSSLYFEPVTVTPYPGSLSFTHRNSFLSFASTTQDVISELGVPSRVYYKEEDKMRIHSASASPSGETGYTDYFYNYFQLGIDILFDAQHHVVKKFVLHTNFPTHYEFNQYCKCNFKIELPPDEEGQESRYIGTDMKVF
eukprot:TRINITY_DN3434_c0_g1_i1.p1 TRINITY_DN3434_c0_g1~~TRINITY_DN3434_c0_g1_i1.p1  ORF type:complete len:320 (+),score=60.69 TRINITY_DN3434_c0_g1_i1:94-1053(+)